MDSELAAASSFLSTYLPSPSTSSFSQSLHTLLVERYQSHWHSADPERGSAFRALVRNGSILDASIVVAAAAADLSQAAVQAALGGAEGKVWLGDRWTLWVDPGCVSLRVDRSDGGGAPGVGREGQFIEIYGRLPASLSSHAIPLDSLAHQSLNIRTTPPLAAARPPLSSTSPPTPHDGAYLSPTKRSSKAIQILRPPSRASSATYNLAQLQRPSSPVPPLPNHPTLASPFVIPPTPMRPVPTAATDVFSPSSSPAPSNSGSSSTSHASNLTLSAPTAFVPLFGRRTSSRGSSVSSGAGSSSDEGEDSVFSSTDSLSSSITSAGTLWKTDDGHSYVMDGEFKYPSLPPSRPSSALSGSFAFPAVHHQRSFSSYSSHTHNVFAPGGVPPASPTSSTPSSPAKPRRRGTRGGGSSHSNSLHEPSSSITSISSITSSASSSTSTSRTREQALQGTLTEHSGGKVGVLGGGVLLGLASAKLMGNARAEVVGEAKRRGRERRRGAGAAGVGGQLLLPSNKLPGWEQQQQPMGSFHHHHAGVSAGGL